MDKILEGLVKGVLSGDTVLISGKVDKLSDRAPEETLLSFNFVNAPRSASNNNKEEEPFGWESRNFLRGLVIGKVVKYTIDYRSGERAIGQIFLDNKNINLEMVRRGYAKVGNINKQNESFSKSEYYSKLVNYENEAKKNKDSVWGDKSELEKCKRTITKYDDKDFDFGKLEEFYKGKEIDVIVEHVINCAGYVIFIKGLNCIVRFNPRFLAIPNNTKEPIIYKSGKAYVERLILHRDFKVKVYSVDENKNLVGDFMDVPGDLVTHILKGGYTQAFTKNAPNITNEEFTLINEAQNFAKRERLRIWKNHPDAGDSKMKVTATIKSSAAKTFEGVCLQIHSGDSMTVKHKTSSESIRIFLSHLKAPKLANPNANDNDQPWAWQAKEFLRKNYVGKAVHCEYDFSKTFKQESSNTSSTTTATDERTMNFFTVSIISDKDNDVNINAQLIKRGYANYVTPKVDDQNTSNHLDLFNSCFSEAKEKKVGIHSTKDPGLFNYSDLFAANKQKIKEVREFLSGRKNLHCVVEHVISGSRLKLRIEDKKCMIPFNLLGIKTFQKDKNNTDLCEKIYQQALDYASDTILQRECKCDIVQTDRVGNYFGYLFFNNENYSVSLLKAGLAVVNSGMTGSFTHLNLYKKTEEEAKENKVNVWKYDGLISLLKEGDESYDTARTSNAIKLTEQSVSTLVKVSEFIDFTDFNVNYSPNKTLDKITDILGEYDVGKKKAISLEPPIRKGVLCAAKYPNDESYYRATVLRTFKDDRTEVEFIDYGTIDEVSSQDLIKLDSSIAQYEPQSVSCELAYLRFNELSMKKAMAEMKTFGRDPSKQYYTKVVYTYVSESRTKHGIVIYDTKDKKIKDSINYRLLEVGFAMIDKKKTVNTELKDSYAEAQKKASSKGIGIWADTNKFDDEEEGF